MLVNIIKDTKTLDYAGRCERPWVLPLRHNLLFKTARKLDLSGELPLGAEPYEYASTDGPSGWALVVDADTERVRLRCGRCKNCANRRKRRWERSAAGYFRTTDLTLFGSLTFSNEFFSARMNARSDEDFEAQLENLAALPGFDAEQMSLENSFDDRVEEYDADNEEHFSVAKQAIGKERQLLMKRLRMALKRDPRFEGIKLVAHLAVYELGDLRKRLHMHFLMHFDLDGRDCAEVYSLLRSWIKTNWHGRGVGFADIQQADKDFGDGGAAYLLMYLVKFTMNEGKKSVVKSRSRLATSRGYLAEGRSRYFNEVQPSDPGVGTGDPSSPSMLPPGSVDGEGLEVELSAASKMLTDGDVGLVHKNTARVIAEAREAFNDGELHPGFDFGLELPAAEYREFPPGEEHFAGWLLSHFWSDKYQTFRPEIAQLVQERDDEGEGEAVAGAASPSDFALGDEGPQGEGGEPW